MKAKKLSLALILVAFLLPIVSASTVTRTLPDSVKPGETISVSLDIAITGGESYYLVDEKVPDGWTIVSGAEEGTEPGHIKLAVIQNAVSKKHTYQVTAPKTEGTYVFSGKYMFEGMTEEGVIGGQNTIVVMSAPATEIIILPVVIIGALALSFAIYKARSGYGK
ncbi:MAG: hypothetical protein QXN71_01390 [Candidatus Aenigmatarchaeota archaeon]